MPAIERLEPQVAPDHHVLAVATLVRTRPHPRRKAIGGRASEEKALVLDMRVTEA